MSIEINDLRTSSRGKGREHLRPVIREESNRAVGKGEVRPTDVQAPEMHDIAPIVELPRPQGSDGTAAVPPTRGGTGAVGIGGRRTDLARGAPRVPLRRVPPPKVTLWSGGALADEQGVRGSIPDPSEAHEVMRMEHPIMVTHPCASDSLVGGKPPNQTEAIRPLLSGLCRAEEDRDLLGQDPVVLGAGVPYRVFLVGRPGKAPQFCLVQMGEKIGRASCRERV